MSIFSIVFFLLIAVLILLVIKEAIVAIFCIILFKFIVPFFGLDDWWKEKFKDIKDIR